MEPGHRGLPPAAWLAALLVVALVAGALSGGVTALLLDDDDSPASSRAPDSAQGSVPEAVAKALPAVVTVINELPASAESEGGIAGGAGFIVDERGFIVTNEHLVRTLGRLSIILANGEIRGATLVSHDGPYTDLALLKIGGGGLQAISFANSDSLTPGETVVAIGSPDIDYRNSVSTGVVSGLARRKQLQGVFQEDLIQTDAAINVGNSGGPLINLNGQVVGLVTFRDVGADDGLTGIAFAVASNRVRPIAQSMIQRGSFPRPYLGVEHLDIEDAPYQSGGQAINKGAVIQRVFDGSPAAKSGLRAGDVILRLGRVELNPNMPLLNALGLAGASDRLGVQYLRDGRVADAMVELVPR